MSSPLTKSPAVNFEKLEFSISRVLEEIKGPQAQQLFESKLPDFSVQIAPNDFAKSFHICRRANIAALVEYLAKGEQKDKKGAIEVLLYIATLPEAYISQRAFAFRALSRFDKEAALRAYETIMAGPEDSIKSSAIRILVEQDGFEEYFKSTALYADNQATRLNAMRALTASGEKGQAILLELKRHENSEISELAINQLSRVRRIVTKGASSVQPANEQPQANPENNSSRPRISSLKKFGLGAWRKLGGQVADINKPSIELCREVLSGMERDTALRHPVLHRKVWEILCRENSMLPMLGYFPKEGMPNLRAMSDPGITELHQDIGSRLANNQPWREKLACILDTYAKFLRGEDSSPTFEIAFNYGYAMEFVEKSDIRNWTRAFRINNALPEGYQSWLDGQLIFVAKSKFEFYRETEDEPLDAIIYGEAAHYDSDTAACTDSLRRKIAALEDKITNSINDFIEMLKSGNLGEVVPSYVSKLHPRLSDGVYRINLEVGNLRVDIEQLDSGRFDIRAEYDNGLARASRSLLDYQAENTALESLLERLAFTADSQGFHRHRDYSKLKQLVHLELEADGKRILLRGGVAKHFVSKGELAIFFPGLETGVVLSEDAVLRGEVKIRALGEGAMPYSDDKDVYLDRLSSQTPEEENAFLNSIRYYCREL